MCLWTSACQASVCGCVHPVCITRFPSFRTQPLENLSVDSVTNGFLSNPAPGENLDSGNLVVETGCKLTSVRPVHVVTVHTLRISEYTPNLPTNIADFRGFDSSMLLLLNGGILMSIGDSPEILSQAMLVGIMLVGKLGVKVWELPYVPRNSTPQSQESDSVVVN